MTSPMGRVGGGLGRAAGSVRRAASTLAGHVSRRALVGGAVVAVVAALTAGLVVLATSGTPQITVTADFAETPGLYIGNLVDVLGLPVGHIIKITPEPSYVAVEMHVDAHVHLPASVDAYLMAPNVVNDRYVQLDPAYSSGPMLTSGTTIPMSRTADPVTVDQIIDTLNQLAVALGPKGANANGALSQLFHAAAKAFGGDGQALNQTLSSFGQALGSLSANSGDVTSLINGLGNLTQKASQATNTYESFASDLAAVSSALVSDSSDIQQALATLNPALAEVAKFVQANGDNLGSSISNLEKVAAAIGSQQQTLRQLLSVSPLALENLANAYDAHPAGGGPPALRVRYDPISGSAALTGSICGETKSASGAVTSTTSGAVLRLLLIAVDRAQDPIPTTDLACGFSSSLQTLPIPPGASTGPNLTLESLLAAQP